MRKNTALVALETTAQVDKLLRLTTTSKLRFLLNGFRYNVFLEGNVRAKIERAPATRDLDQWSIGASGNKIIVSKMFWFSISILSSLLITGLIAFSKLGFVCY